MRKIFLTLIALFIFGVLRASEEPKLSERLSKISNNYISNITKQIDTLKNTVANDFGNDFLNYCIVIICLGAIFYVGMKIIRSLQKGNNLEFDSLILPFLFIFLISSYRPLTTGVDYVTRGFEYFVATKTKNINEELGKLRDQKIELCEKINQKIYEKQIEKAQGWFSVYWVKFKKLWRHLMDKLNTDGLVNYFFMLLMFVSAYLVRVLGGILTILLYLIGPFAISVSMIPIFKDSWKTWLTTYIYVQLFAPVSQLIGYVLANLEKNSLNVDIVRLEQIYTRYAENLTEPVPETFYSGITYLAFMAAGVVMYWAVPTICAWIVPAQGGSTLSVLTGLVTPPLTAAVKKLASGTGNTIGAGKRGAVNMAKRAINYFKPGHSNPTDQGIS